MLANTSKWEVLKYTLAIVNCNFLCC